MITTIPIASENPALVRLIEHHLAFASAIAAEIERIHAPAKAVLAATKFDHHIVRNPLNARR
jgi:hypothetical protein